MANLDDREFADVNDYTSFIPRFPADYSVKITELSELQTKKKKGHSVEFKVIAAKPTAKDDPNFDPIGEVGETYCIHMPWEIAPKEWDVTDGGKTFRTLLAAMTGVEHTKTFEAHKVMRSLFSKSVQIEGTDLRKVDPKILAGLDPIVLSVKVRLGGDKEDGGKYVNCKYFFKVGG